MGENTSMTIAGLQLIDYRELEEQLPPDTIRRLPAQETPGGEYRSPELVTAVLMVTAAGVHALATWLAQRRARAQRGQGFMLTISPDHTVTIKLTSGAETDTPSPASDILGVLEEALREAGSMETG
jgi:hypothetical protein